MNDSTGSTGNSATVGTASLRHCHFCGGASLRRSRLRASDLPWLLVLHWPIRCRRCSKRQFVFVTVARRVLAANVPHTQEKLAQDSWQSFTANDSPALRSNQRDEGTR